MRIGYAAGPTPTALPIAGITYQELFATALGRAYDVVTLMNAQPGQKAAPMDDMLSNTSTPIELLLLEWRPRNWGKSSHLFQAHLLRRYVGRIPVILWDIDAGMRHDHVLRGNPRILVCSPARYRNDARRLLIPVDDQVLDAASPERLSARDRPWTVASVGTITYPFAGFFAALTGARYPHVLMGRIAHDVDVPDLHIADPVTATTPPAGVVYQDALATLLLPADTRSTNASHLQQHMIAAVLAGCVPLLARTPNTAPLEDYMLPDLVATDGHQLIDTLTWLQAIAGTDEHAQLIRQCLGMLAPFRLRTQLATVHALVRPFTRSGRILRSCRQGAAIRPRTESPDSA